MSPPSSAINSGQYWKLMLTFPTPKTTHFQHQKTITFPSPTNHHVTGFTTSASISMVQSFNMHQQIYIINHYFLSICVLVTNLLKQGAMGWCRSVYTLHFINSVQNRKDLYKRNINILSTLKRNKTQGQWWKICTPVYACDLNLNIWRVISVFIDAKSTKLSSKKKKANNTHKTRDNI